MKNTTLFLIVISSLTACDNPETEETAIVSTGFSIDNDTDRISYALGVNVAENIKTQGLEAVNPEALTKGFSDYYNNEALQISAQEAIQMLQAHFQKIQQTKASSNVQEGQSFLQQNAVREGVVVLPSGLQYEVLQEGNGPKPGPTDNVTTHYTGTFIDGSIFDSSVQRGTPASFPVNGVIPGWTEALQLMTVGSKWKLFIPSDLAYGPRGKPGSIPPSATLIFELELLAIQ